jgi:hypothetical protein
VPSNETNNITKRDYKSFNGVENSLDLTKLKILEDFELWESDGLKDEPPPV